MEYQTIKYFSVDERNITSEIQQNVTFTSRIDNDTTLEFVIPLDTSTNNTVIAESQENYELERVYELTTNMNDCGSSYLKNFES